MINSYQSTLKALQRTVSRGSKLIIAGAATAVSAALILVLLRSGQAPGYLKIPGLSIEVPSPFAVFVLHVISGAWGWAGWVFLRQGIRLMHHIEFNVGVDPEEIKASLAGSSLASASVLLLKLLCFIAICALGYTSLLTVLTLVHFHGVVPYPVLVLAIYTMPIVLDLPFFFVLISIKMRYFNPSNWDSAHWFSKLVCLGITKNLRRQLKKELRDPTPYEEFPEEFRGCDISNAWRKLYDMVSKTFPTVFAVTTGRLLRKYGFLMFIRDKEGDLDREFIKPIKQAINDVLDKLFEEELSGLESDSQESFRFYVFFALELDPFNTL